MREHHVVDVVDDVHDVHDVDVVVIGAGPAGSALAMLLAEAGLSVALIERDRFPRFHIGESLTGTAGDFVTRHGLAPELGAHEFPAKSGVKVVGRDAAHAFYVPVLRPTWQVRRAEFDALLLAKAEAAGAERIDGLARAVIREGDRVVGVEVELADGTRRAIRARFVADASGQSGFLSRQGVAGPRCVEAYNRQIAVYSQLSGVENPADEPANATLIFYADRNHWAWMIPVGAGRVSVGIVLPTQSYKQRGDDLDAVFDWGLRELNPNLSSRVGAASRVDEVRASRNYSYRIDPFVGPGWLCLGDSHRFTDPIFSFGVSFGLTEAEAAAPRILAALADPSQELEQLAAFAAYSDRGQDRAADLIRYFWRFPGFFAFLTQGKHGGDIIRLLAGDCFSDAPLPASVLMREALSSSPTIAAMPSDRMRAVASAVYERFDGFQGIDGAWVEPVDDEVHVHLLLDPQAAVSGELGELLGAGLDDADRPLEGLGLRAEGVRVLTHRSFATRERSCVVFDRRRA